MLTPATTYPQGVKDALADAETLRLNALDIYAGLRRGRRRSELKRAVGDAEGFARDAVRWMRARLRNIAPAMSFHYAKYAARAAFRAVPGLRGEAC